MIIKCTCLYCNAKWVAEYTWQTRVCDKCASRKPRVVKEYEEEKIDYYQGSPPFPLKETEKSSIYDY